MINRIIISGGGTGGHIYPAIAIANEVKQRYPAATILFVGAKGRMEMEKVPQAGYTIVGLDIAGLQRSLSLKNLSFPWKVLKSYQEASAIIKSFKPQVVVGVGGYASAPTLMAAALKGIPTLIQEQNSYAGLTNKLLSKKAKKVCVAYPQMDQFFPREKLVYTGNPVRKDIMALTHKRMAAQAHFQLTDQQQVLLVMGGSLGARTINESLTGGLARLQRNQIQVIWQTGKHYYEKAQEMVAAHQSAPVKVFPFIKEMDLAYAAADIIISRAGALSISELCLVGKPAILVPSPHVAEDHQTKNARALVDRQAALLVQDYYARDYLVSDTIQLLNNSLQQKELAANIHQLARPKATESIVREIEKLAR